MKKMMILILMVAFVLPMFAQHGTQKDTKLTMGKNKVPNPDELTLAILPTYSRLEIMGMYAHIVGRVKKATGKKVKLIVAKNFKEHLEWMRSGKADIAYSNPVVAAQALDQVDLLVTAVVGGKATFHGDIHTLKSSGIKTLEDCKGKKVGIVSWKSGGGYLSQYIKFMGEGIDMIADCKVKMIKDGKVNKLIKGLKKETFDVICVPSADLSKMDKIVGKDNYIKITCAEQIPNWALSARSNLDAGLKRKITAAFLAIPDGDKALKKIEVDNFTPSDEDEYEPILYILEGRGAE